MKVQRIIRFYIAAFVLFMGVVVLTPVASAQQVQTYADWYKKYSSLSPAMRGSDIALDVTPATPFTVSKNLPTNKELDAYVSLKFKYSRGADGAIKVTLFCHGQATFDVRAKKAVPGQPDFVDIFNPQYYAWYVSPEPFVPVLVPAPARPNNAPTPTVYLGGMTDNEKEELLQTLRGLFTDNTVGLIPWETAVEKPSYWDSFIQQVELAFAAYNSPSPESNPNISQPHKVFHWDLGSDFAALPKTTDIRVAVTKADPAVPLDPGAPIDNSFGSQAHPISAKAKIRWHLPKNQVFTVDAWVYWERDVDDSDEEAAFKALLGSGELNAELKKILLENGMMVVGDIVGRSLTRGSDVGGAAGSAFAHFAFKVIINDPKDPPTIAGFCTDFVSDLLMSKMTSHHNPDHGDLTVDVVSRAKPEGETGSTAVRDDPAWSAKSSDGYSADDTRLRGGQEDSSTADPDKDRKDADRREDNFVKNTKCFAGGTPVVMADGSLRPIESIEIGDVVLSRDELSGTTGPKRVLKTFKHVTSSTLAIRVNNGELIETTEGHPFYVKDRGWTPAGEMGLGTSILTRAGPTLYLAQSDRLNHIARRVPVYNFTVADYHSYFVGKSAIWVHNAGVDGVCNEPTTDTATRRANADADEIASKNAILALGGSIDYGSINVYGQRSGIRAKITAGMIGPNGPGSGVKQALKEILAGYKIFPQPRDAAHLFAAQLGGSGDIPSNLVTCVGFVNKSAMKTFENQVRAAVENGRTVDYEVEPLYHGQSKVPHAFRMKAVDENGNAVFRTQDGQMMVEVSFPNVPLP